MARKFFPCQSSATKLCEFCGIYHHIYCSCDYVHCQVIYPLDVIRRRMQVGQSPASLANSGQTIATNSRSGLVYHLRSLPVRQLYAGLTATYMKVMPAAAISLVCRDAILGRLS